MHARAMTIELLRYPAYVVPTLLLPTVFFLFFVRPGPRPTRRADGDVRRLRGDRRRVLPVRRRHRGRARLAVGDVPANAADRPVGPRSGARSSRRRSSPCAAAALLVVTAVATTGVSLPAARWAGLAAALLAGIVPFAFLGIALGYWAPARGALPIANLLYLVLVVRGRALDPARPAFPRAVAAVSRFLPTRALADALVATALGPRSPGARGWCSGRLRGALRRRSPSPATGATKGGVLVTPAVDPQTCSQGRTRHPRGLVSPYTSQRP